MRNKYYLLFSVGMCMTAVTLSLDFFSLHHVYNNHNDLVKEIHSLQQASVPKQRSCLVEDVRQCVDSLKALAEKGNLRSRAVCKLEYHTSCSSLVLNQSSMLTSRLDDLITELNKIPGIRAEQAFVRKGEAIGLDLPKEFLDSPLLDGNGEVQYYKDQAVITGW